MKVEGLITNVNICRVPHQSKERNFGLFLTFLAKLGDCCVVSEPLCDLETLA